MCVSGSEGDASDPAFDRRWFAAFIGDDSWHFHRRLFERYGVVLGPGEYTRIQRDIRRKRVPLLKQRPDGAGVFPVWIPPLAAPVFVVARPREKLLTALPANGSLMALVPWSRVLPPVDRVWSDILCAEGGTKT